MGGTRSLREREREEGWRGLGVGAARLGFSLEKRKKI
jgi:hypothetical protein